MNAERLLAHFERISEAPDAVARLRRFILDLAVRGKLVEQDPEDEPAGELLLKFQQSTRKSNAKGTRVNRGSQLSSMAEPRHSIPDSWMWAPIGMIFCYDAGTKTEPKILEQNSWLLELEDLEKDTGRLLTRSTVSDRKPQSTKSKFQANDILYGKLRPYLNKVFVADRAGYSSTEIVALRPILPFCSEYCKLALRRPDFVEYVTRIGQGTKMPRLRTEDAVIAPFPLPPLAEQHRIVAKVDELMALCDQLEAARQQREHGRERLVAATLQRLNQPAEDPASFRQDASFALQVLPSLTTTPAQIKQLRQTILNLAVRGKLVEQDPEDEPAEELLALLATEKQTQRNGRNWEANARVDADPLFDMPRGWHLTAVAATARRVTVGYVGPMKDQYVANGIPFLRSQNVRANRFREDGLVYISRVFHSKIAKSSISPGDVVVVRSGNVGTACVVPASISEGNCSDLVIIQEPICVCPEYLCFYLNSMAQAHVVSGTVGVALNHFNTKSVANIPIPLPPLAEQHRIVAKVDELMALCDQLEQHLSQADQQRGRLLEAVLAEALGEPENTLGAAYA